MGQRLAHRPARVGPVATPSRPLDVVAPPAVAESAAGAAGAMQVMLPILGGGGSLVMILANRNALMLIAGAIMLGVTVVGGVVAFALQRTGASKRAAGARVRYLGYLDGLGTQLDEHEEQQRAVADARHPAPSALPAVIADPARLWHRRRADPDFLVLRIGTGTGSLTRPVVVAAEASPMTSPEPVAVAALDRLRQRATVVENLPMAVPVQGVVSVVGARRQTGALLRALLTQLAVLHAPDDVRVVLCIGPTARAEFEWTKWLPHVLDSAGFDGPVGRRFAARTRAELTDVLGAEISRRVAQLVQQRRSGASAGLIPTPRLVVIADQATNPGLNPLELLPDDYAAHDLGLAVLSIVEARETEPGHVDVRVTIEDDEVRVEDLRSCSQSVDVELERRQRRDAAGAQRGRVDPVSPELATAIARQLAPLRLVEDAGPDAPLESTIELNDLVGVADVGNYDAESLWTARPLEDFLRIPFGLGGAGQKVFLDLKESAHSGMGPHGLCVGATGSGKSEVLRTLVLTLAMTHAPDRLAVVLVDYKGGATFAGLEGLPHTAAMVSNLSDDTGLVDRLHDALRGEINRRQQLLLDAGSLANVIEYNARRDAGQDLSPLPNLFVVIDEFGEMLTAKPDFIELFLQIGRVGRSIGVHLLLASQRLEEGRLRGLESYLSYRLGLRTFNPQESRAVLDVPDAYELPPIAGSGYLKVDTTIFERFKAAYVSGTYRPRTDEAPADLPLRPMPYPLFNETSAWLADTLATGRHALAEPPVDHFAASTLDVVVNRLHQAAPAVAQIWLPPLPSSLPLDAVLGGVVDDHAAGLVVADPNRRGTLRLPIGILDRPADQWQGPLELDLSGGGGHVAVLGAPLTGKSNALRTMIAAAALTHTPNDVAFYCLDLGGGGLRSLAGLPHVGGVAGRLEPDRVRRTVAEIVAQLVSREQLFGEHRLDSIDAMRAAHSQGRLPELAVADVFLVIDNWGAFKDDFEDLAEEILQIGTRGLGYGVHLMITAGRFADFRLPVQAVIGTKLELRLNDPLDSVIDRKAVANLRADTPGRVVTEGGLTAQLALARIDGAVEADTAPDGLDHLVGKTAAAWPGPPVAPIRMLPTLITRSSLHQDNPGQAPILLGLNETELGPVRLDLFRTDPHLLVFGEAESGKTNLARLIVAELTAVGSADEVVFAAFDLRRTLLDVIPERYLGAYAGTLPTAAGAASGVASELRKRLPPDDVTTSQLRERSWWSGPEIVVLVDDYDLLAPAGPGPLAPLLEFLPQARDVGLHLVVLRRSGGASRAVHEPVLQRMRELGATGLLLSGERQEGQLWPGAYLSAQPPGRGLLVRRGQLPRRIQLAYEPESLSAPAIG